ncbi:MAG: hypothetical protein U1C51_08725 [Candidatus Izemoplasmatales bacterium]|nr:hypothetical protein [bacterium]MDZ4197308.1 hypothetical protein [Candidatus Izemoplasmatales bacterium]
MSNRINVDKEFRESRNHEQFRFLIFTVLGVGIPISLWLINEKNIESPVWRGFFTVLMVFFSISSFTYGAIKMISIDRTVRHYRHVLTLYADIDERTHIPTTAIVTTCIRPDTGRYGFQKINYYFWIEESELVFFPVHPEFLTCRSYKIVQSIRLNRLMVRSFTLIGEQFDEEKVNLFEMVDTIKPRSFSKKSMKTVYRDTRATLVAYAFGDQTLYLAFDYTLYDRLHELMPERDKTPIESIKNSEISHSQTKNPVEEVDHQTTQNDE